MRLFLVAFAVAVWAEEGPVRRAFDAADGDSSGALNLEEFRGAVATLEREKRFVEEQRPKPVQLDSGGFASVPRPRLRAGKTPAAASASSNEFSKAFVNSLGMIWATELGDKTFFIAAVLAMRHSRCVVFTGALLALIIMTILSAALGYALPSLLPRRYTHYASACLFLYFGVRLLRDARSMNASGPSDELVEVEDELAATHKKDNPNSPGKFKAEEDNGNGAESETKRKGAAGVLSQALVLTFLAEWGDRSQIATIALAAAKDPFGVSFGAVTGHAMCTGLAVVGGRMLASRISERTVAVVGGCLFLVFAAYALFFETVPPDDSSLSSSVVGGGVVGGGVVGAP